MRIGGVGLEEYTAPNEVEIEPSDNVVAALLEMADLYPDAPALAVRSGDRFEDVPISRVADTVLGLAAGLVGLGIERGDRIAIFSPTRIEFTYLDYAIWAAGGATVTIYETSSSEQVEWILKDSGSVALICSDDTLSEVYREVASGVPNCRHVFVLDNGAVEQIAAKADEASRAEINRRVAAIDHSELATLVYTSGTTGKPKGCIINHGNLIWEIRQASSVVPELVRPGEITYQFLPLAHVLARVVNVVGITGGVKIAYSTGTQHLVEELAMVKPGYLVSHPRVFEKIYNGAKTKADAEGKGRIFDLAARVAIDASQQGDRPSLRTRILHPIFERLVYSKIRAVTGGSMKYAISGAAPLGERLGHFFRGVGIATLEGYGLTETTAAITVNTPSGTKVGTVGRPLPGASVRIAEDGEILLRGGCVFQGYWHNEAATADAFDGQGWFRSGDIGELDEDGYLRITGRKKEILVTAAGKNVAPAVLEDRLRAHPLVSQCLVVGDGQPFIAALVTVDEEAFPRWASQAGKEGKTIADLIEDTDLVAALQQAVDEANKAVSRAESIRAFRILPEDFSVAGGELTPSLKVKRDVVAAKYASLIEDIFRT
ncbi:MAG TPA: long-chain fatty acid--CoA ligase [Acidimicrobiia bacterium]